MRLCPMNKTVPAMIRMLPVPMSVPFMKSMKPNIENTMPPAIIISPAHVSSRNQLRASYHGHGQLVLVCMWILDLVGA